MGDNELTHIRETYPPTRVMRWDSGILNGLYDRIKYIIMVGFCLRTKFIGIMCNHPSLIMEFEVEMEVKEQKQWISPQEMCVCL